MKLYCVQIMVDDKIEDIWHMFANNNKELHKRLDENMEEFKKYNLEYNGYKYFEIKEVDGLQLDNWFGLISMR